MKQSLSPTPSRIFTSSPTSDEMNKDHLSFQFQDGRLVTLRDAGGVPVAADRIRDLDALHHVVQQNFPAGHATIILDQTALLSTCRAPASERPSSAAPIGPELAVERLLVCQPVAAALLAFLSLADWFKLRRVSHCWRDTVDQQLKSLKQLNVCDILERRWNSIEQAGKQGVDSLLGFMPKMAPAVQSLIIGKWIAVLPEVPSQFEKVKHLDLRGAQLNSKLFEVLEKLTIWESLQGVSLPGGEPFHFRRLAVVGFKDRLEVLIGRFQSLESLTFTPFSHYPTLLDDLKNPEKLTSLSVNLCSRNLCPLSMLRSLPRFNNLQHLALQQFFEQRTPDVMPALEAALNQLKALKHVVLDHFSPHTSAGCFQRLTELPHLKWLAVYSEWSSPKSMHWTEFSQLTCLELGPVQQSIVSSINQITTLTCLKLAPSGRVKFACSLPQLRTLSLAENDCGSFKFDFQPACCNVRNLTLNTHPKGLLYINEGLLQHNTGIRNIRLEWDFTSSKHMQHFLKAKCIAKDCKALQTLEIPEVYSADALSLVVTFFMDVCPLLKHLNINSTDSHLNPPKKIVAALKEWKEFRHLVVSICSRQKDSWLFL